MMRHKYGFNCQWIQFSKMLYLTPVLYLDVVPGESISGSVSVRVHSAPAVRDMDTRVYLDAYAFHIPFRLLWSGWPDFITRRDTSTQMPRVTVPWGFNFENRLTENVAAAWTNNSPWLRYMYNTVVNKFFIQNQTSEIRSLTSVNPYEVYQRPSTLETASIESSYENQDTTIVTPASVQSLKSALQQDAFAKMRAYYGDRYIDYLAAVGVSTDWGILQEPEVLAKHHSDWRFKKVPATTNVTTPATSLGEAKGVFDSTVKLHFKRKFFAEHGLVGVYVVTRSDPHYSLNGPPQPPVTAKVLDTDYWSPERDNLMGVRQNTRIFAAPATPAADTANWTFPQWEEYRLGINCQRGDVIPAAGNFYGMLDSETSQPTSTSVYKKQTSAGYDANFQNSITLPTGIHYQATMEARLARFSPIRHADVRLKLS